MLAVSGGVDSIVLFDLCCSLRRELKLEIAVAHVDHKLRAESSEDAVFVRELAEKQDVQFYLKECSDAPETNIEAWAREERYSFFKELREGEGFDWILTAHTANDQAETLLLKLAANRELILIQERDQQRKMFRPMLGFSREQVLDYAKENNISHREDSTNSETEFLRNKVRHEVIPAMQACFGGDLLAILASQGKRISDDTEALNLIAQEMVSEINEDELETEQFLANFRENVGQTSLAIQWRCIEQLFLKKLGYKIGQRASNRVLDVFFSRSIAAEIPGAVRISRSKGRLNIENI